MPGMLTALVQNESSHRRAKGDRTCQFQDRKSRKNSQNKTEKNKPKTNRDPKNIGGLLGHPMWTTGFVGWFP